MTFALADAGSAGESATLGISAKSIHAGAGQKGEIQRLAGRLAARRTRFDLTRHAARILYDPDRPPETQHRTVWCHRSVKNTSGNAYIWRRDDGSSARMTGVTTCGNVWTCPVCSARVAERRREEVEHAMRRWIEEGGHVFLLTLTSPHDRDQVLAEFERAFAKALQRFKNSRAYKRILGTAKKPGTYARAGSIRSAEITWGPEHGWHPHTHDLVFARPGLADDAAAIDELKGAWVAALLKAGLGSQDKVSWMWEHGLDLRGGQYAADYVAKFGRDAKWGVSSEITRQHAKIGMRAIAEHSGHVTPFQILAWSAAGDAEADHLFRDYAAAMEGKRMLYWSPGLKARLGVAELDDEDIAGADDADRDQEGKPVERMVATITADDLSLITSRHALGELLEFVAMVHDPGAVAECVVDFLDHLRTRPKRGRGDVRIKLWQLPGFSIPRDAS